MRRITTALLAFSVIVLVAGAITDNPVTKDWSLFLALAALVAIFAITIYQVLVVEDRRYEIGLEDTSPFQVGDIISFGGGDTLYKVIQVLPDSIMIEEIQL